jgi:ABC-type nitrate/sulfonate/bicarbonate transport system permease component
MNQASPPKPLAKPGSGFLEWLGGHSRAASLARTLFSLGLLAAIWEVAARTVVKNRLVLVPFTEVLQALGTDAASGALMKHTLVTMGELAIAFPVSVVIGVAIGLVLSWSRLVQQVLDPLLTAMYSVPVVALAPLFIAWMGFGLDSKIAIILLVSVFPLIINTEVGLRSTDSSLIEAARSFNATRWQVFRTVTFPFAIPFIIGGVRVAFARALVGVIVAEFFGAYAGYGYAILAASQNFKTGVLLGYVLLLGLIGMLSSIGLRAWERKLAPWREVQE